MRRVRSQAMSRRARITTALVAISVPILIVGNSLLVLLMPWLPAFQYALPEFPEDPSGLTGGERTELANTGVRSIWPVGPGPNLLETAELPDGEPAFTVAEISHMDDVRAVVRVTLGAWLAALAIFLAGAAIFGRGEGTGGLRRALLAGGLLTAGLLAVVALIGLTSFDFFFEGFHSILFESGTWQFPMDSTLIELYPERFWMTAALIGGLLILAQVVIAVALGRARPDAGDPVR